MTSPSIVVIGSGIVGLATAWRLLQTRPHLSLAVIDKEPGPARHQSGHNSGVIHSGIYYAPGSLKAFNCVQGRRALIDFCREHGIAHDLCGKVIVATDDSERARLASIHQRGIANGVSCREISAEELREIEPHCAGVEGLFVEDAGIVDFPGVCEALVREITRMGGQFHYGEKVLALQEQNNGITLSTDRSTHWADLVINCAGLYSDKVAAMDVDPGCSIVPFRGEYYLLKPESRFLVRNLIYPVPDPAFPFLGVHFTRRITGAIECGPNAVLAFAREGYSKSDIHLGELAGTLTSPAFMKLALKHWRMGLGEYVRSFSKAAFVTALQKLLPAVQAEHLEPAPAGVRAQALSHDGTLMDDFHIRESRRAVHVCNAPSPAATACLAIGEEVARRALAKIGHSKATTPKQHPPTLIDEKSFLQSCAYTDIPKNNAAPAHQLSLDRAQL